MLRIALADDQALIRHGLKALLESLGGIQVVVEADNGDIRMPRRSGIS
jgi:DNA-binding NarL/FixJ family response regulator